MPSETAGQLCALVQHLATIASIISLKPMEDYLHIQGIDCCQICLFDCKLRAAWFQEYSPGEPDEAHINAKVLSSILRMVGQDQTATLCLSEDSLNLKFQGAPQEAAVCESRSQVDGLRVQQQSKTHQTQRTTKGSLMILRRDTRQQWTRCAKSIRGAGQARGDHPRRHSAR